MNFRGRADLFGQHVEFEAAPADNANAPLSLRLLVSSVLTQPEWRVELSTAAIPASWLLRAARNLGTPLPDGLLGFGALRRLDQLDDLGEHRVGTGIMWFEL